MTPTTFGRRALPGGAPQAPGTAPSTPGSPKPALADELRVPLRKMLVIIPSILLLTGPMVFTINHSSSSSGSYAGFACRSKKAAGSVFDIDWCQAGAAALQGAARGAAGGAAARR